MVLTVLHLLKQLFNFEDYSVNKLLCVEAVKNNILLLITFLYLCPCLYFSFYNGLYFHIIKAFVNAFQLNKRSPSSVRAQRIKNKL